MHGIAWSNILRTFCLRCHNITDKFLQEKEQKNKHAHKVGKNRKNKRKNMSFPVSTYKSKNVAQSQKNSAPSYDSETVIFKIFAAAEVTSVYLSKPIQTNCPRPHFLLKVTNITVTLSQSESTANILMFATYIVTVKFSWRW